MSYVEGVILLLYIIGLILGFILGYMYRKVSEVKK